MNDSEQWLEHELEACGAEIRRLTGRHNAIVAQLRVPVRAYLDTHPSWSKMDFGWVFERCNGVLYPAEVSWEAVARIEGRAIEAVRRGPRGRR